MNIDDSEVARRRVRKAHPTRARIIDIIRASDVPMSPSEIAVALNEPVGAVAYHVRLLAAAGVLELAFARAAAGTGAMQHFYTLDDDNARIEDAALTLLELCDSLHVAPIEPGGPPRPTVLDDAARDDLLAVIADVRPQVRGIALAATNRASR